MQKRRRVMRGNVAVLILYGISASCGYGETGGPLDTQDAQDRPLASWMRVDAEPGEVHEDAASAVYPAEPLSLIMTQQRKLLASGGAADEWFGCSVAISGDTALVGAYRDTELGLPSGAVQVFVRSGGVWTLQAKFFPNDATQNKGFGYSVALSGDTALVGAPGDAQFGSGAGAAYVFARSGGVWTLQAKLGTTDSAGGALGYSVALEGDTALLGAPYKYVDTYGVAGAAYVFARSGGAWTQQAKLVANDPGVTDYLAESVALSGDTALLGARGDDDKGMESGSAYVFVRNSGVWTQQAKLLASDGDANDWFGASVALSMDTALVGAKYDYGQDVHSGSAYVFVRSGGAWTEQAKLLASDGSALLEFGRSTVLQGDTALVGSLAGSPTVATTGAAYMFVRSGGVWTEQQKLWATDGEVGDLFGVSSMALDGNKVLIGAMGDDDQGPNSGSAYIFMPGLDPGNSCTNDVECVSGFCVDGVCCTSACGDGAIGDCQACSVAAGAAADGTCGPLPAATVCRASVGACDLAEECDGVASACPLDALAGPETECRPAAGECDMAETCSGISETCPTDDVVPNGTMCSGGVCMDGLCSGDGGSGGGGSGAGGSGSGSGGGGSGAGGSGNGSGGGGSGARDGGSDEGGCACRAAPASSTETPVHALSMLALGYLVTRRRRNT